MSCNDTNEKHNDKNQKNYDGKITSFRQFKALLDKFESDNKGRMFYFRGEHSIHDYSIPSIYRDYNKDKDSGNDNNFKNGIANESDQFYSDLLVHLGNLDIFNMPYSNQLAKFQHYQAPTRLLDITANPLIALFFALERTNSNKGKNRTIYFYAVDKSEIKYQDGHTVNMEVTANWMNQKLVHNFIKAMKGPKRYKLINKKNNGKINNSTNEIDDFMSELNRKDKVSEDMTWPEKISDDLNRAYFVNFVRESSRMQRQQGAFIMPKYLTRLEDESDIKEIIFNMLFRDRDNSSKDGEKHLSKMKIVSYFNYELYKSIILATKIGNDNNNYYDYYYKENHPGFRRYTIPSEFVEKMRKDINALGINSGFVYPDIEHYSQFLIDSYNER